jgi:hypothetical protein
MATTTSGVSKVGTNYYTTSVTTNTDGSLKSTTSRTDAQGNNGVPVSTVNTTSTGQSTRTFESGATASEKTAFNNPRSPERRAYTQQVQSQNPYGANPTAEQQKATNAAAGKPNAATDSGTGGEAPGGRNFDDDIKGSANTRNKFPDNLKYPETLDAEKQDVIKFNMIKFEPRKFETNSANLGGVAARKSGQIIGVVVLPIPNGISDSNTVKWGSEDMNAFDAFLANTALTSIKEGFGAGAKVVQNAAGGVSEAPGEVGGGLAAAFAGLAIGQGGAQILQRTEGAILNPNMELLFGGPSLRPFTFTFKLASRRKEESEMIRKIIRFFKQGSAAQKSESNLFLKSPHTFQIEYLHKGKPHTYLNKFKECALQSFGVSYTPEGQYATFNDGAMVSYQISMQFQELDPIFNEDYTALDQNKDTEIGF